MVLLASRNNVVLPSGAKQNNHAVENGEGKGTETRQNLSMERNVLCALQQRTDSHLSQAPVKDQQPKNVKDHKHLSSEYQERLKTS